MTYWFHFQIPQNADGSRVSYSPNYHGTLPRCPKAVTVLLYNDKEGFGIAKTEDTFVPKEVTVLKETDALALVVAAKDEPQVYFGAKIATLWDGTIIDKTLPGMAEIKAAAEAAALKEVGLNGKSIP